MKCYYVLGVETSCDDTAIGVVKFILDTNNTYNIEILSNIKYLNTNNYYNGIVPEIVARNQVNNIDLAVQQALSTANIAMDQIDIVGATSGPGLIGSLLIGYNYAAGLAFNYNKPLVPVHHIEGHILSGIPNIDINQFPFLSVIVSGGHTLILYCCDLLKYQIISESIDDACGELFDKVSVLLGLGYPGGIQIEKLAVNNTKNIIIDIPMSHSNNFSFSGLKTKFKNLIKNETPQNIAWALQDVVSRTLIQKIQLAIKLTGINKIIVGGGVSANQYIRKQLTKKFENIFFPDISISTDNGCMIAYVAFWHYIYKKNTFNKLDTEAFSRMSINNWCSLHNTN